MPVIVPIITLTDRSQPNESSGKSPQNEADFVGEAFAENFSAAEAPEEESAVMENHAGDGTDGIIPAEEAPVEEDLPKADAETKALSAESCIDEPQRLVDSGTRSRVEFVTPRGKNVNHKLILRSRTKKERKRFTGSIKRNRSEAVKLAPTYKILPKREDREESITFKTKNPRARAKIKRVMERWEPK